jgi:hypothetical protein
MNTIEHFISGLPFPTEGLVQVDLQNDDIRNEYRDTLFDSSGVGAQGIFVNDNMVLLLVITTDEFSITLDPDPPNGNPEIYEMAHFTTDSKKVLDKLIYQLVGTSLELNKLI